MVCSTQCFDPHEPFVAPERFKAAYDTGYNGKILNWPLYEKNTNSPEEIAVIRGNYAALVVMCDEYFGKLLDYFDFIVVGYIFNFNDRPWFFIV